MVKDSNTLGAFWMPFTANRQFKKQPRMMVSARDMHYVSEDGREILDGTAGLWCVNAGHCREKIVTAIQNEAAHLDYSPAFQIGHPNAFKLASNVADLLPDPIDHVFFTNSGSEAVETALKIAIGYHNARGESGRTRLIGRERGYHGVNFGGISVGGLGPNRKSFGPLLPGVDHLPHTYSRTDMAFSRGQPEWGAHLADDLERIVALHDASTIAAVIVEPMAGSAGVIIPPKGYLQRLREICGQHGILLIFDEVITGFGRTGHSFAAETFGVTPDLLVMAKGLTNGAVPMGAVGATREVHDAFMRGPEGTIELFHGYTYSSHPLAVAAGLATLDVYREEGLFENAAELAPYWEDALHSLEGLPNVIDVRNIGLVGAIELEPIAGKPTARAFQIFLECFHERDLLIRTTGDIIALSPPLILNKSHIDQIIGRLAGAIRANA
ncbi:MAG: aspartate aminotransferase family protein [Sphingomonadales bacterium]